MPTGTFIDETLELEDIPSERAVAIDAGNTFSMALDEDGTVWMWGNNGQGQLGLGYDGGPNSPDPAAVPGLPPIHGGAGSRLVFRHEDETLQLVGAQPTGMLRPLRQRRNLVVPAQPLVEDPEPQHAVEGGTEPLG